MLYTFVCEMLFTYSILINMSHDSFWQAESEVKQAEKDRKVKTIQEETDPKVKTRQAEGKVKSTQEGKTKKVNMIEHPVSWVLFLLKFNSGFESFDPTPFQLLFTTQKGRAKTKHVNKSEENETYVVEKIVKTKKSKGKNLYLVKWSGYPSSNNSWEPEENLNGAACE